jgi:hypothetical protein
MANFWTVFLIVTCCIISLNAAIFGWLIVVNNRLTLIEERQANDDIAHFHSISRPDPTDELHHRELIEKGLITVADAQTLIAHSYRYGNRVR